MSWWRPWFFLSLAGYSCLALAQAPTNPGTPAAPGSGITPPEGTGGTRPAPTSPTPAPNGEEEPPPLPAAPKPPTNGTPTTPRNPFGFGDPTTDGTTTTPDGQPPVVRPGGSSNFGTTRPSTPGTAEGAEGTEGTGGRERPTRDDNETTFSAPGFFGSGQQTFNSGQGRFAKPRYRYGVSASIGFDDNYQQTPNHTGTDSVTITQTIPAQEEVAVITNQQRLVTVAGTLPGTFFTQFVNVPTRVVLRPATPEQQVQTVIPGLPEQPRLSSIISSLDGYFSTQWVKAREALTFDLRLGLEYYFDKEIDPLQYNGSLSLLYVRKLSPRMQFSANANISYQPEPDVSQVNVSTQQSGAYFNGLLKFDLSYRWTPHFSTNTSFASQGVYYESSGVNANNSFYDLTLGNEFRYIWSPRTTYVLELRATSTQYLEDDLRNSDTVFFLLGLDQRWSKRLSSTFRVGETRRTFEQGNEQQSPYGELSLTYLPSSRSQLTLSSRYGFEATDNANQQNITFRTSINYSRGLTPRMAGTIGLNYVDSEVTSGEDATATTQSDQTIDGSLGLNYRFSRRFTMSARYSYTMLKTNFGFSDYDRSRLFISGTYDF